MLRRLTLALALALSTVLAPSPRPALAAAHNTTREAIALAWLLRHPAGIQPIIGTTNVDRLIASCQADAVTLTREEWYSLLTAARGANHCRRNQCLHAAASRTCWVNRRQPGVLAHGPPQYDWQ